MRKYKTKNSDIINSILRETPKLTKLQKKHFVIKLSMIDKFINDMKNEKFRNEFYEWRKLQLLRKKYRGITFKDLKTHFECEEWKIATSKEARVYKSKFYISNNIFGKDRISISYLAIEKIVNGDGYEKYLKNINKLNIAITKKNLAISKKNNRIYELIKLQKMLTNDNEYYLYNGLKYGKLRNIEQERKEAYHLENCNDNLMYLFDKIKICQITKECNLFYIDCYGTTKYIGNGSNEHCDSCYLKIYKCSKCDFTNPPQNDFDNNDSLDKYILLSNRTYNSSDDESFSSDGD